MSDTKEKVNLTTPEARISFPHLFTKGLPNDRGDTYFEATLLFSPAAQESAAYKTLKQACIDELKKQTWFDKDNAAAYRLPFRKCSEKPKYYGGPEFDGWTFISVKSKNKPGVVDRKVNVITDESEIGSGDFVRVSCYPFAYDTKGNKGVSLWMNNVQKLRDGDPLGGGSSPKDDFEPVGDESLDDVDSMFD